MSLQAELAMATAAVKKRKRIVLTIEDKLEICKLVKQGKTLANVAALFNIGKSTVHDIIKNEDKVQTFLTEVQDGDSIKKRRIVKRPDYDELDKTVFLWFVQPRYKGKNGCSYFSQLVSCLCF